MTNEVLFQPKKGVHYWSVKLSEKQGEVTIEGWIRFIPAANEPEAGAKAIVNRMKRFPGSEPEIVEIKHEIYIPE